MFSIYKQHFSKWHFKLWERRKMFSPFTNCGFDYSHCTVEAAVIRRVRLHVILKRPLHARCISFTVWCLMGGCVLPGGAESYVSGPFPSPLGNTARLLFLCSQGRATGGWAASSPGLNLFYSHLLFPVPAGPVTNPRLGSPGRSAAQLGFLSDCVEQSPPPFPLRPAGLRAREEGPFSSQAARLSC